MPIETESYESDNHSQTDEISMELFAFIKRSEYLIFSVLLKSNHRVFFVFTQLLPKVFSVVTLRTHEYIQALF